MALSAHLVSRSMVSLPDFIQMALIRFSTALATSSFGAALRRMNSWSSCCARVNWTFGATSVSGVVRDCPRAGPPGAAPRGAPGAPGGPGATGGGVLSGEGNTSPGPGPGGCPSPGGGRGLGLGVDGPADWATVPAATAMLKAAANAAER